MIRPLRCAGRIRWLSFVLLTVAAGALLLAAPWIRDGAGKLGGRVEASSAVVRTVQIPDGSTRLVPLSGTESERAADLIETLPVQGRGPKTGYERDLFGDAWEDDAAGLLWSANGCRTRDDILARDLDDPTKRDACVVVSGDYVDPYTGDSVQLAKAQAEKSPIDHLVPISFAWQMGAAGWSADERLQFANDPLNLVLTTKAANEAKSDSDPASWLPPNKAIRCAYVERFALVSLKYGLPVTPADKTIMLSQCASD